MNVGMQQQVLSPGVEDADHTDLGSQVFRIRCNLQQGLCAGGEQQIVKPEKAPSGEGAVRVLFVLFDELGQRRVQNRLGRRAYPGSSTQIGSARFSSAVPPT